MTHPAERPETPEEAIAARRPASRAGPDGASWDVRRRWVARFGSETVWARFRRRMPNPRDRNRDRNGDGDGRWWTFEVLGEAADGGVLAVIAAIALALILSFLLVPVLVGLLDVALMGLLAALGMVVRGLFGRPWIIEAVDESGRALRWRVKGWRASQERMVEIRDQLAAGIIPPDAESVR